MRQLERFRTQFPYSLKARDLGSLKPISKDEITYALERGAMGATKFFNPEELKAIDLAMKQGQASLECLLVA